jgi:hypothetical protein
MGRSSRQRLDDASPGASPSGMNSKVISRSVNTDQRTRQLRAAHAEVHRGGRFRCRRIPWRRWSSSWAGCFVRGSRNTGQPAAGREPGCAAAIVPQAVIADVLESVGHHMQWEATDELVSLERHGVVRTVMFRVFPSKRDIVTVEADEPKVGDRHPMVDQTR